MPTTQTKGITVKIDAALHAEIKAYLEQNEMTMSEFIALAVQDELHPKIQQEVHTMAENMRTLAFQVPESLFQRIKDYLARNNMTQKAFVIGLLEEELDRDEELLHQQGQAQEDTEEEQEDSPVEDETAGFAPEDEQPEYGPDQEETPAVGDFGSGFENPDEGPAEGLSEEAAPVFAPEDEQLIAAVNAAFGTTLTAKEFTAIMTFVNNQIVEIAKTQLGNVDGQPYWSWYGFGSRVEWCACFVSWCANQCGYIKSGICPKFAGCSQGSKWFKNRGQWLAGSGAPSSGMIIFFDWEDEYGIQDGSPDHVGIVEKVENGRVYTIEGNASNACKQCSYPIGYFEIYGYGILAP